MSDVTPAQTNGLAMSGLLRSIVLNAAIPLLLYTLSKRYVSGSEVVALSTAAIFPLVDSLVGVLALLGIAVSRFGVALGGDPRILLIRESFFTCALGIACFVSLALPRPLMFYFGRQFFASSDPARLATYEASSGRPAGRRVHRLSTTVWGFAFVGEFVLRVILVFTVAPAVVLAVSPFPLGGITIATILWTFAYGRRNVAMYRQQQAQTA